MCVAGSLRKHAVGALHNYRPSDRAWCIGRPSFCWPCRRACKVKAALESNVGPCSKAVRDGLDTLAELGIKSVIQPGGSKRDAEVIAAADEHGIAMVFTGMRHFRH